jgi:ABC-type bacteriocin/lantibiotic exporter with double-glycine peptidase domain
LLYNDLRKKQKFNIKNQLEILNTTIPKSKFESIELKKVSFSYNLEHSKDINNITLKIKKGDSIGIIGQSGSGKTTLVDILLGLIDVDEGSVLYNNANLKECLHSWRSNVAYIPQNIFIIDDTLRRNIALGVPDDKVSDIKLQGAIQKAQLSELCGNIPNGLDAILGEGGICLSGGQRQRIALARAFYHDRSILVMDEATSALDADTEDEISNEIKNLKQEGDKTIIIIAHRLSTIKHCDYFYKIERGSIVSQGSYDTVVNTN